MSATSLQLPAFRFAVLSTGDQSISIWAENDGIDRLAMTIPIGNGFTVLQIKDMNSAMLIAKGKESAFTGE